MDKKSSGKKRKSSIRIMRSIIGSLLSGFTFRPFMFFIIPGFILMLLSFYPLVWSMIHTLNYYQSVGFSSLSFAHRLSAGIAASFERSPHSFLVGGITLMVAIQFLSLGFLALQNKRYFEELFHLGSMMFKANKEQ